MRHLMAIGKEKPANALVQQGFILDLLEKQFTKLMAQLPAKKAAKPPAP